MDASLTIDTEETSSREGRFERVRQKLWLFLITLPRILHRMFSPHNIYVVHVQVYIYPRTIGMEVTFLLLGHCSLKTCFCSPARVLFRGLLEVVIIAIICIAHAQ